MSRKTGKPRKPRRASPETDEPQATPIAAQPERDELEEVQRSHPDDYQSEK